jgi:hypothetical protein
MEAGVIGTVEMPIRAGRADNREFAELVDGLLPDSRRAALLSSRRTRPNSLQLIWCTSVK